MKSTSRRFVRHGGYFGLLALLVVIAIALFLYFGMGGGKQSYVSTVVKSKETAKVQVSRVDMSNLSKDLQMAAAMGDGKYPATVDQLISASGIARSLAGQAEAAGGKFVYVEGQSESMPPTNIIVYVTGPDDEHPAMVLRLGGTVEELKPAQLTAELAKTRASIR